MLDPKNLPEVMTDDQVEWFILFGICVAGKSADQTTKKLNSLLGMLLIWWPFALPVKDATPFQIVANAAKRGKLNLALHAQKLGQYQRIEKAMVFAAANLDVTKLTLEDLEAVPGIGPKTARMVMLYSDLTFNGVPLDTHILKYLATIYNDVPKSTPPAGKRYEELEWRFQLAAKLRGYTVRELDTLVWKAYQSGDLTKLPGTNYEAA